MKPRFDADAAGVAPVAGLLERGERGLEALEAGRRSRRRTTARKARACWSERRRLRVELPRSRRRRARCARGARRRRRSGRRRSGRSRPRRRARRAGRRARRSAGDGGERDATQASTRSKPPSLPAATTTWVRRGTTPPSPGSSAHASRPRSSAERELAAPDVGLGLDQAERPSSSPAAPQATPALGALDGRGEIVRLERLLGGAAVPAHAPRRLAAAPEVLGHRHRVGRAVLLQPLAGEAVAERAVRLGQHGVGRLAHQRVAEDVVGVARRRRGRRPASTSSRAASASSQAPTSRRCDVAAEQRGDRRRGEAIAEDARRAEDALGLAALGVEARLHRAEHRVGERVLPAGGDGADQLLEVEGVAVRAIDDARHHRVARRPRRARRAPASRSPCAPAGRA